MKRNNLSLMNKCHFSIVAAIAKNSVIGKDDQLPWDIPEDLARFYELVNDKVVVMGRKTYESIGRPIQNSTNIILSRDLSLNIPGCLVVHSVLEVLERYKDFNQEIMVIGGAPVYEKFLPLADTMYLTFIHADIAGNVFFPKWDEDEWSVDDRKDFLKYSFVTFKRLG